MRKESLLIILFTAFNINGKLNNEIFKGIYLFIMRAYFKEFERIKYVKV